MKKEEYLEELKKHLKRLPHEDFVEAMDYFTEYFDEVGPSGEADLIEELGRPKEVAHDILNQLLDKKLDNPEAHNHRELLKLTFLLILSAPFTLPLLALIVSLILTIFSILFAIGMLGLAAILVSGSFFWDGVLLISQSFSAFLLAIGIGLVGTGLGILVICLSIYLTKKLVLVLITFIQKIMKRGHRNA